MKKNIIKEKSFLFAIRVVRLYQYLCDAKKEYVLSKQLLRSGTAIGALVREVAATAILFFTLQNKQGLPLSSTPILYNQL